MAAGAVSSARDPQRDMRWKWLLVGFCALLFATIVAAAADDFGFLARPWYGWWGMVALPTTQPYLAKVEPPDPGGAAAQAGIRSGDLIDLREQNRETLLRLYAEPLAAHPMTLVILRNNHRLPIRVVPSTIWEGSVRLKVPEVVPGFIASTLLLACALLISVRRATLPEGRMLALILLLVAAPLNFPIVVPNAIASALPLLTANACFLVGQLLLVVLSSRFGSRTVWRRTLDGCAYAAFTLNAAALIAESYGLFTLRIDPMKYGGGAAVPGTGLTAALSMALSITVAIAAIAAVVNTARSERPRTAWLLLPLPVALVASSAIGGLQAFAQSWAAFLATYMLAACATLLGAVTVTYALLRRRVLDFGFVLNRAVVVSIVGLVVVIAFVLLEWMLGSVLTGASHATGLIANAALALIIGVSLNYIHKRVDQSVDLVLFRKRHEDEKSLLAFSKEAAYITEWDALLDATLEKVSRHTDARSAAVLIASNGCYNAVRSFRDNTVVSVNENDEAILALKVWHKPIDPHHYETAINAALALPMLSRGKLYGVLVLGERAGGEAYAPDEVEALSQLANGVGSALEALSLTTDGSATALADYVAGIHNAIESMGQTIVTEFQKLKPPSLT